MVYLIAEKLFFTIVIGYRTTDLPQKEPNLKTLNILANQSKLDKNSKAPKKTKSKSISKKKSKEYYVEKTYFAGKI